MSKTFQPCLFMCISKLVGLPESLLSCLVILMGNRFRAGESRPRDLGNFNEYNRLPSCFHLGTLSLPKVSKVKVHNHVLLKRVRKMSKEHVILPRITRPRLAIRQKLAASENIRV